jgi:hypothetical protein
MRTLSRFTSIAIVACGLLLTCMTGASASVAAPRDVGFGEQPDTPMTIPLSLEEKATVTASHGWGKWFSAMSRIEGFQSGGLNSKRDRLEFYWHGSVPEEGLLVIAEARATSVPVDVFRLNRSFDEADVYSEKLGAAVRAAGVRLTSWGVTRDHSRVEMSGPEVSEDPVLQERVRGIAASVLPVDMGVVFEQYLGPGGDSDSRHDDTGNPTPGAEVERWSGTQWVGVCTAGLGLRKPGGGHYLLTALHCFNHQTGGYGKTAGNAHYGETTGRPTFYDNGMKLDAALISFGAGGNTTESQMFWGSNTTSAKTVVEGTELIPYNIPFCQSGAGTGLRCNLIRDGELSTQCVVSEGVEYCVRVVDVESANGALLWGGGDSGGPIYRSDEGVRKVVGIVKGYRSSFACGSSNWFPDTRWTTQGTMTPISKIMDKLEPLGFLVNSQ